MDFSKYVYFYIFLHIISTLYICALCVFHKYVNSLRPINKIDQNVVKSDAKRIFWY